MQPTALVDRLRGLPPVGWDIALTAGVLAAQLAPFVWPPDGAGGRGYRFTDYLPVLAASLPLLLRRRYPLTVLLAVLVGIASYDIIGDGPAQPLWYGWLAATYTVADRSPRTHRIAAIVCTVTGTVLAVGSVPTAVRALVTWAAAYALGRAANLRRAYTEALEERAARLERERELQARQAAQRERDRIARDMHDILAHGVSLMVVQAEAGPLAVRTRPERAEAAFDAIAGAGRDAMAQLRRMLGMLRDDAAPGPRPQTLDLIPELVSRVAGAGLRVELRTAGRPGSLAPDVEVAACRIVQEGLTNVVKHARASNAEVRLEWGGEHLVVTVTDDGPGPTVRHGGGHGLIGIRERAVAAGGTARAGPAPHGGFVVRAELPVVRG